MSSLHDMIKWRYTDILVFFQVYAVKDRAEVEAFAPSAKMINIYYDATNFNFEDLKTKLEALREKVNSSWSGNYNSYSKVFFNKICVLNRLILHWLVCKNHHSINLKTLMIY